MPCLLSLSSAFPFCPSSVITEHQTELPVLYSRYRGGSGWGMNEGAALRYTHTHTHTGLVAKSCLTIATPWTVACQASLSKSGSWQMF